MKLQPSFLAILLAAGLTDASQNPVGGQQGNNTGMQNQPGRAPLPPAMVHPQAVQAHPQMQQVHPQAVQGVHPQAVQAHPQAIQAPPQPLPVHPQAGQAYAQMQQGHPQMQQGQGLSQNIQAQIAQMQAQAMQNMAEAHRMAYSHAANYPYHAQMQLFGPQTGYQQMQQARPQATTQQMTPQMAHPQAVQQVHPQAVQHVHPQAVQHVHPQQQARPQAVHPQAVQQVHPQAAHPQNVQAQGNIPQGFGDHMMQQMARAQPPQNIHPQAAQPQAAMQQQQPQAPAVLGGITAGNLQEVAGSIMGLFGQFGSNQGGNLPPHIMEKASALLSVVNDLKKAIEGVGQQQPQPPVQPVPPHVVQPVQPVPPHVVQPIQPVPLHVVQPIQPVPPHVVQPVQPVAAQPSQQKSPFSTPTLAQQYPFLTTSQSTQQAQTKAREEATARVQEHLRHQEALKARKLPVHQALAQKQANKMAETAAHLEQARVQAQAFAVEQARLQAQAFAEARVRDELMKSNQTQTQTQTQTQAQTEAQTQTQTHIQPQTQPQIQARIQGQTPFQHPPKSADHDTVVAEIRLFKEQKDAVVELKEQKETDIEIEQHDQIIDEIESIRLKVMEEQGDWNSEEDDKEPEQQEITSALMAYPVDIPGTPFLATVASDQNNVPKPKKSGPSRIRSTEVDDLLNCDVYKGESTGTGRRASKEKARKQLGKEKEAKERATEARRAKREAADRRKSSKGNAEKSVLLQRKSIRGSSKAAPKKSQNIQELKTTDDFIADEVMLDLDLNLHPDDQEKSLPDTTLSADFELMINEEPHIQHHDTVMLELFGDLSEPATSGTKRSRQFSKDSSQPAEKKHRK